MWVEEWLSRSLTILMSMPARILVSVAQVWRRPWRVSLGSGSDWCARLKYDWLRLNSRLKRSGWYGEPSGRQKHETLVEAGSDEQSFSFCVFLIAYEASRPCRPP